MAEQEQDSTEETLIAAPVIALQEIGGFGRNFLREVGSMFWFIVHTLEETIERFGVIMAIGRVVDVVVREGEPLLFFRGAYR